MIIFFFFIFLFTSCSRDKSEIYDESIDSAKLYLTKNDCDLAIQSLESIGRDSKNIKYLQTLASAYACKSGYTATTFFGTNLPKMSSGAGNFFGSLVKFTTSEMSSPTDPKFEYLQKAIDILLYSGGVESSSSDQRSLVMTESEFQDVNMQNIFMIITQLGKFIYYYGNADPVNGVKGLGSAANGNTNNLSNGCFYNYNPTNATLQATMDLLRTNASLGSCTITATGHEKLQQLPNTSTIKRICQGVILFNNLIDIVVNTDIPSNGAALQEIGNTFQDTCKNISGIGDLCSVFDQDECENDFSNSPASDKLQLYFFFIFETYFK
jgi:hypothetical protein